MQPRTRRSALAVLALAAGTAVWAGCGEEPLGPLPETVELPAPEPRVTQLELVEDLSEQVADRLLNFSDKVRRRDLKSAREFLARAFYGHSTGGLPAAATREEHLEVEVTEFDVSAARILRGEEWLAGIGELIGPWQRVDSALFKVKGAEFRQGRGRKWGVVKLFVHMTGTHEGGGGASISAWAHARVERERGQWKLARFRLDSLESARRARPVFSDVSTAAGVAHTGMRFGQPGNQSFAFNGAACGDVDGDGRWDLFVPSDGRNFLYMGTDEGTFREQAEARGVLAPAAGTGTALFDFDNDGDQDLVVAHVDDEIGGDRMELYVNDGTGHFARAPGALGMGDVALTAYSLTVFDYDGDGWLDVYVCGYGMVEVEHNNSWIEATNGAPNALFRNVGGERFVDAAAEAGVRGDSWTYASAAADWDADGDVDLYVANDYGTNRLYRNEGDGTFSEVAEAHGVLDQGNGMGAAFGDLSGDGRLDLYVSNMSSTAGNRILDRYEDEVDPTLWAALKKSAAGNTIFQWTPGGVFERLPKSAGGVGASWAWSAVLSDFDLDGRLDVFCTNGFVTGDQPFDT